MNFFHIIDEFVEDTGTNEDGNDQLIFGSYEMLELATVAAATELKQRGINAVADGATLRFPGIGTRELAELLTTLTGYDDLRPQGRERAAMSNSREGTFARFECFLEYCFGYDIGFSDEYTRCDDCGKLIHTIPEYYGDNCRYRWTDDMLICRACDEANPGKCLEEYLACEKPWTHNFPLDPAVVGFKTVGHMVDVPWAKTTEFEPLTWERGLHEGQKANPRKIKMLLAANGINDVLFLIDTGQFDAQWSIAVPADQADRAYELLEKANVDDVKGPADYAKEGLQNAAVQMQKGATYVQVKIPEP